MAREAQCFKNDLGTLLSIDETLEIRVERVERRDNLGQKFALLLRRFRDVVCEVVAHREAKGSSEPAGCAERPSY
jgi:hypothetical protein